MTTAWDRAKSTKNTTRNNKEHNGILNKEHNAAIQQRVVRETT